jgi:hypothetical protein
MTAPSGVTIRLWHVTLPVAEKFLALARPHEKGVKGTNRKWSPIVVNRYAYDMLAGNWKFTHQGLAFTGHIASGDAEMKDGEQRMRALIQAATTGATLGGVTLPPNPDLALDFYITEGLTEDSWLAMDSGKTRTAADHLSSEGEVNSFVLSSTITLCFQYQQLPAKAAFLREHWSNSMTPVMRSKYLHDNPGVRDATYEGARLGKVMTVSAAAAGYFLALDAGVDKKLVEEFMDCVRDGVGDNWEKGNPILVFRELLLNSRGTRRFPPREEQLALFIKSFNAFAKGQKILNLSFRTKPTHGRAAAETYPVFHVSND